MKAAQHNSRRILLLAALSATVTAAIPFAAQAQTGGTTGTGAGFTGSDIFPSVQKDDGVNLNELNRARYLNRASCLCRRPAVLKAVVLPSGSARAALVSPSASVSMYIGNSCDVTTNRACCHFLKSIEFSQFRTTGITAPTDVDDLSRIWALDGLNCGDSRTDPIASTGTGGTSGSGGSAGTNGAGGNGGVGGTAGTGGTGSGGATATGGSAGTVTGRCSNPTFSQTLWILVGTTGMGSTDVATRSLGFQVDPEPPPAPAFAEPGSANEALLLNWTGLTTTDTNDLLGYQILCSRDYSTQVFKTGTFTAAFDSCPEALTGDWPSTPDLTQSAFVCSSLLSPASTSYRLKILENKITYYVGVAAIDKQLNASIIQPRYKSPEETTDFYTSYRHRDPQGQATGGYCAVSGGDSMGGTAAPLSSLVILFATLGHWRRPRRRR